jgi:hypothetical protein
MVATADPETREVFRVVLDGHQARHLHDRLARFLEGCEEECGCPRCQRAKAPETCHVASPTADLPPCPHSPAPRGATLLYSGPTSGVVAALTVDVEKPRTLQQEMTDF